MFSCHCLNILIEIEKDETITKDSLDFTDEEKTDPFFNQERWYLGNLCNINKVYSGLIRTRQIGLWTISRCLNCNIETHAIHKEKGATNVLLYCKLLNQEAINKIRSNDLVSNVFNIIVNSNPLDSNTTNTFDTYQNRQASKIIKDFNEAITNYIRKEQAAVKERIKKYSDEQYELLNICQDKAYRERDILVRIVQNYVKDEAILTSPKTPTLFANVSSNEQNSGPNSPSDAPFSPKRPKGLDTQKRRSSTYREDLMFDFETEDLSDGEYNDGNMNPDDSDGGEIEGEDVVHEGIGMMISRKRFDGSPNSIAKSCPVDIPIFSQSARSKNSDSDRIEGTIGFSPRQNEQFDIAASIKALARSVHGDAIFGELPPRPKFSTQI